MRLKILLAVTLCVGSAGADGPYRFPIMDTADGPLYVMKGSEHPEAIPYYTVWHGEFETMAQRRTNPSVDKAYSRLKLSAADRLLFYKAADGQAKRDADCKEHYTTWANEALKARGLTKVEDLMRQQTPEEKRDPLVKELGEKQMVVEVGCRAADLRAADEMLAEMSPAGRAAMLDWVKDQRRTMTAYSSPERMPWHFTPEWAGAPK